ncbi:MAG: class I SAM-dependent rRNA methyltransferase [Deltaproteobacteria bacterium]|nr:class I SAM-dependent rRNA methyltransferase [Deltaproteobacteria bacterium]
MKDLRLKQGEEVRLLSGHLWIYAGELAEPSGELAGGELVRVVTWRGEVVGYGLFSATSRIAVRLLTRGGDEQLAEPGEWIDQRLRLALQRRERWAEGSEMMRLVHGEADGLPGLVVDRYGRHLVLQIHCTGFERRKETLVQALLRLLQPESIVHLRRSLHRRKEGLGEGEPELLQGVGPPRLLTLREGDLLYEVDAGGGPKGGFFLDQRANRLRLRSYVRPGDRVLDLFAGSGGFGFAAQRAGAAEVTLVDSGAEVLARAQRSAELNGLQTKVERADLFGALPQWAEGERREAYDVVVLDPPGLARARASLPTARRSYRKINEAALRLVRRGGTLLTCSCSQLLGRQDFLGLLGEAARRAGRWATVLEASGAAPDHPVLPGMPETEYLKALFVRVD